MRPSTQDSIDLNNLIDTGICLYDMHSFGGRFKNRPNDWSAGTNHYGVIIVFHLDYHLAQLIFDWANDAFYFRNCDINDGWRSWKKVSVS